MTAICIVLTEPNDVTAINDWIVAHPTYNIKHLSVYLTNAYIIYE
jgi:hypothetical protein